MYKLIIVEDEEIIRRNLIKQIPWEEMGFQVICEAANGKEALDIITRLSPDVVLTDINMPVSSGIELMSQLRRMNLNVKVVVLSVYNEFEYARESIEYGVSAYILKPIRENDVRRVFFKLKNELDNYYNLKNEYENTNRKIQTNLNIIKEKVLSDILEGRIKDYDYEKLHKMMDEICIKPDNNFCVFLFKASARTKIENTIFQKHQLMEDFSRSIKSFPEIAVVDASYDIKKQVITLIISSNSIIAYRDIIYVANTLKKILYDFLSSETNDNTIISLGIGNFYNYIYKLDISRQEAEIALKNTFFKGKGTIIHINDCTDYTLELLKDNMSNHFIEGENQLIDRLINAVFRSNLEDVLNIIAQYWNLLYTSNPVNTDFIYTKTLELIMHLSFKFDEKDIDFSSIFNGNIPQNIRNLIDNETFLDLKYWINSIFTNAVKYLKEKDSFNNIPAINKIIKYVNENFNKKITLEELSSITYMTPSYLSTFFKQKTGETITDYLTALRINKAKELLQNSDMKVYEIAAIVGYDSFRHFSKVFKKVVGKNPAVFK